MPVQQNSTNLSSELSQLDIQSQRRRPKEFSVSNQQVVIWRPIQPALNIGDSEFMAHSRQPPPNPDMSYGKSEHLSVARWAYTNATLLNPLFPIRAQQEKDIRDNTKEATPELCTMLEKTSISTYLDEDHNQSPTTNISRLEHSATEHQQEAGSRQRFSATSPMASSTY